MNRKPKNSPANLEWHGRQWRVVYVVPRSRRSVVGKAKIKVGLGTGDLREAEALKHGILAKLAKSISEVKPDAQATAERNLERALMWRATVEAEPDHRDVLLDTVIQPLVEKGRGDEAASFLAIVDGKATPFTLLVDDWIAANLYSHRTAEKARHALSVLTEWCNATGTALTFEAIDRKAASRFIRETFIDAKRNTTTANVHISWITRFWKWCRDHEHYQGSDPWSGQRIKSGVAKRLGEAEKPKRPFTDDEVKRLLEAARGTEGPMADFLLVASLTGMRRGEIGSLQVSDVRDGCFHIQAGKTEAAKRIVPVHPMLAEVVQRRVSGKASDASLFDDLPGKASDRRDRTAALSQAFTRMRQKLGIGEQGKNSRQATTDLHSFRRWFINGAVGALGRDNPGFTAWTISDVVGHSKEEGPLGMTMGRYPGKAPLGQLRACVEAVKLP